MKDTFESFLKAALKEISENPTDFNTEEFVKSYTGTPIFKIRLEKTVNKDKKYIWLNTIKGTFSNSWNNDENDVYNPMDDLTEESKKEGWKLIEYECKSDKDFEFFNQMKLR